MGDNNLSRLEEHMVQLISMVAENNKSIKRLEQRFEGLGQRFEGLEQRFDEEKKINNARHAEVIKEIRNINGTLDYLVTNYARHDVDIHRLKEVVHEKEQ